LSIIGPSICQKLFGEGALGKSSITLNSDKTGKSGIPSLEGDADLPRNTTGRKYGKNRAVGENQKERHHKQ